MRKASLLHERDDAASTGVSTDRFRNVAIRVRIPVQYVSERAADERQIGEIDNANGRRFGTIEVERQQLAAGPQHTMDLVEGAADVRHVAQSVPGRDKVEGLIRKWERH